jgi:6-phosphogluconolactonase (cycloisomerase 2 family)
MKWSYLMLVALLFVACDKDDDNNTSGDVVYFQTNNHNGNQNAILAYRLKSDGQLEQLSGSPFPTGGSGVGNPMQILGPNDSDTEVKISEDGKFLLAVNSGSNNISVFRIESDGRLTAVAGSPFSSGGETPVSIDMKDQYVYVVNKSQNPINPTTTAPNYTTLTIDADGKLTSVPNSKVETTPGSSPAQALLSNDEKFVFGADFLGFQVGAGTLRSFMVADNGSLTAGSPQAIPGIGGALGLWQHPSSDVLYVGFPLQAKLGVYSINNSTGALTFTTSVDAGPAACWVRTTRNGNRTYVLNSAENTISTYNTTTASAPVGLGKLTLKNSGPIYMAMGMPFTTSEPFSFEISTNQDYLVVVNQHTNPDFSIGNFNFLHVVKIGSDGTLSEPSEPIQIPIPNTVRPKGVVIHHLN